MPDYVLDQNSTDINAAINRAHDPNTSPQSGVTDKFVTSDGIYQALNSIGPTNFADASLIESTETWESSNGKLATTQAIVDRITAQMAGTYALNISNTSNVYQNTSVGGDTFFKSTHFSGNGGFTGSFADATETSTGSGIWEIGTAGLYLIHVKAEFNDTSQTSHNMRIKVNNVRFAKMNHPNNSTTTSGLQAVVLLDANDQVKVDHDDTGGSGGNFRYRNAHLRILKIG